MGNKGQAAESGSQDSYEATVLDFLDKEMSAVQPSQKPKEYSEELDALVSDLLKQVINEADQKKPVQNTGESIEDLLAEFEPLEHGSPSHENMDLAVKPGPKPDTTASHLPSNETEHQESLKTADAKPIARDTFDKTSIVGHTESLFAAPVQNKRKISVIAIAFAGLLLIVGGVFYFSGKSTGRVSEQATAQSATVGSSAPSSESKTPQVASQPVAPPKQAPVVPAPSANRPVTEDSSKRASVAPEKNTRASEAPKQQPTAVSSKSAKASETTAQPPAAAGGTIVSPPPKMETPAAPIAIPPVASNTSAPSEKPVAPAISESTKPPEVVVENKPAPSLPSATNPAPTVPSVSANTATSTPEPQPNIPTAAAKNTSPAVPISQANPQYPELALRTRASATIVLDVNVDSQGRVTKATPVSGPMIFHNEAIKAAMKWRYKPASIDGTNVPSQTRITFNFNLKK